MAERKRNLNRLSGYVAVFLSVVALLAVLSGFTIPPQNDEGAGAHIFQLSIVLFVPTILVFVATADWKTPWRSVRPLLAAVVVLVLAFGALYYLENVRDPNYHRASNGRVGRNVIL